ncbi:56kDa selenium binding protein (SBP56) domain-containing protein [Ditylenchus destructor]|nr:56kDa selenium binding protein (SBP56) domain-containing protein [Ditylenchus destructor]
MNLIFPYTTHCLANGKIMISTLGNAKMENEANSDIAFGNFIILDAKIFEAKISGGFNPQHVTEGHYGNTIHVWDWSGKRLKHSITLEGPEGQIPLEVRFLHNPDSLV